MQHLEALAPFVPVAEVRAPQVHLAHPDPVGIENVRLFGAISPQGFIAPVRNLLVHSDRQVAPHYYGAHRGVFNDAHTRVVGVLVGHTLRAAPPRNLLAFNEFVAHPVAFLGHEAGRVGDSAPEHDPPGLLRSESDDHIGDSSAPAGIKRLVVSQGDVPGSPGQIVRPGREHPGLQLRRLRLQEFPAQDTCKGILILINIQFVNNSVKGTVDRDILILEETRSRHRGPAHPKIILSLFHTGQFERRPRHFPAVDCEIEPASCTELGRETGPLPERYSAGALYRYPFPCRGHAEMHFPPGIKP